MHPPPPLFSSMVRYHIVSGRVRARGWESVGATYEVGQQVEVFCRFPGEKVRLFLRFSEVSRIPVKSQSETVLSFCFLLDSMHLNSSNFLKNIQKNVDPCFVEHCEINTTLTVEWKMDI